MASVEKTGSSAAIEDFDPEGALTPGTYTIEASAGSGKTSSIELLVLRLVAEQGLDLRRILVVTFTDAAAAQLRHRVRERLRSTQKKLKDQNDAGAGRIALALARFDEAFIGTIHGFCKDFLTRHALDCRVPLGAEVAGRDDALLEEIVGEFWSQALANAPSRFGRWLLKWDSANSDSPKAAQLSSLVALAKQGLGLREGSTLLPAIEERARIHNTPAEALDGEGWLGCVKADLIDYVRRELPRRTADRGVVDFDGLLRAVHRALVDPTSGASLALIEANRFDAVLIDEFQDTDPTQWEIFERIFVHDRASSKYVFLIGDPKQAIYGFRGADVHAYLSARSKSNATFRLRTNYRSDRSLVEAINFLYGRGTNPFLIPEIHFDRALPYHEDRVTRTDALPAPITVRFVRRDDSTIGKKDGAIRRAHLDEYLPELVAHDIRTLLESRTTIRDERTGERVISARDVAVLVRSGRTGIAVQRALAELRVPSILTMSDNVHKSEEALELRRVLSAIVEPSRSKIVGALSTCLFGLRATDIALLISSDDQWTTWFERFRSWRRVWEQHGFAVMFDALLREQRVPERILSLPRGERQLTNLLHLAELTQIAARDHELGPASVVAWLEREYHVPRGRDTSELRLESDAHAVAIGTMHGAKGLEYPIVFCPELWGSTELFPADKAHTKYFEDGRWILDVRMSGPGRNVSRRKAEMLNREENARLAYVAITRARHAVVTYYGAFAKSTGSPISALLAEDPDRAPDRVPTDEDLRRTLAKLAELSNGRVAFVEADPRATRVVETTPIAPENPRASTESRTLFPATYSRKTALDTIFGRSSFTSMTSRPRNSGDPHAQRDQAEQDYDVDAVKDAEDALPTSAPVPLAQLPKGAGIGVFLHQLFEEIDFQNRAEWSDHLERLARLHAVDIGTHKGALLDMLEATLSSDLGGFSLRDIAARDRLVELSFDMPLAIRGSRGRASVTPAALAAAMEVGARDDTEREYARSIRHLAFDELRGTLTGAMDLVVRHAGRYYVLDYKSNHLGDDALEYAPTALRPHITESHYALQYHVYTAALDAYLRTRLRNYDYERHMGGSRYLFLRGFYPNSPSGSGVFVDRIPAERVRALGVLFAEGEVRGSIAP